MKRVLITGATGFVGQHLTDYLSAKGEFELFGTTLTESTKSDKIKLEELDLKDFDKVSALIEKIKPDQIYHLAAFTSPADSFKNPTPVVLGNIELQMNVFNALRNKGPEKCRILSVTSAEVYGLVGSSDLPIDEETPMNPVNPYGVSKVAQDYLALQYSTSYKMDIVRVRPFNHTGTAQSPAFVIPAFARQIALIEKGKQEPVLKVGNLAAKRDLTDVRDIVRGYHLLMEKGSVGEVYNIGSGRSHQIQELLDMLLSFSDKKIEIQKDPEKLRPSDIPDIYCDCSKLNKLTGWSPEIKIEQTLKETLDYWRNIV